MNDPRIYMRPVIITIPGTDNVSYSKGNNVGGATGGKEIKFSAYFHRWIDQPVDDGSGYKYVNCTMGLVEGIDGAMHSIHPTCIRFTDFDKKGMTKGSKVLVFANSIFMNLQVKDMLDLKELKSVVCEVGSCVVAKSFDHFLAHTELRADTALIMRVTDYAEIAALSADQFDKLRRMLEDSPGMTIILIFPDIEYAGTPRMEALLGRTIQITV